jgi:hypothetical protein
MKLSISLQASLHLTSRNQELPPKLMVEFIDKDPEPRLHHKRLFISSGLQA